MAATAEPVSTPAIRLADHSPAVLAAIAFGILFLVVWELFVEVRNIKPYLLPKPSAIWGQFHGNFKFIRKDHVGPITVLRLPLAR